MQTLPGMWAIAHSLTERTSRTTAPDFKTSTSSDVEISGPSFGFPPPRIPDRMSCAEASEIVSMAEVAMTIPISRLRAMGASFIIQDAFATQGFCDEAPFRNPITGIAFCARATIGHEAVAATVAMNSRRVIRASPFLPPSGIGLSNDAPVVQAAVPNAGAPRVRFRREADVDSR